ncbi:hypothetical protein [Acidovorax sp. 56]|uniref:hypothetical protein n=1 Tax=Acidovorax sp. 56 TaxID=2035205 RepID=UPI000C166176|nr:hypothetical protein [Acidovorax sp. 56]
MNTAQHLTEIRNAVGSRNKRQLKQALDAFEDSQLLEQTIGPEVLEVYKWLLSDRDATAAPGVDRIFTTFVADIDKYSASQIGELVQVIDEHQSTYVQQMLRHTAADFIARNDDPHHAFDMFKSWARRNEKYACHMALVGIEVLLMSGHAKQIGVEQEAKSLWNSLVANALLSPAEN